MNRKIPQQCLIELPLLVLYCILYVEITSVPQGLTLYFHSLYIYKYMNLSAFQLTLYSTSKSLVLRNKAKSSSYVLAWLSYSIYIIAHIVIGSAELPSFQQKTGLF